MTYQQIYDKRANGRLGQTQGRVRGAAAMAMMVVAVAGTACATVTGVRVAAAATAQVATPMLILRAIADICPPRRA